MTLSKHQISDFCSQIHLLLNSGIPLVTCLEIYNKHGHKYVGRIIDRLREGEAFGASLNENFPPLVVSSVSCAEQAGNLENVLRRLAEHYENLAETEGKVKAALVYPIFIIVLSALIIAAMIFVVLPSFRPILSEIDGDLPFFTRLLFGLSDSLVWIIAGLFVGGIIAAVAFRRNKKMIGGLLIKQHFFAREETINFCRTLGALLEGGVPLLPALKATVPVCQNPCFRLSLVQLAEELAGGESFGQAVSRLGFFPKQGKQMIAVADNSGRLGEMLSKVADYYEKERELSLKKMTALLEPSLTLVVGLIVGFISLAMFIPLMNIVSRMQ